MASKIVVVPCMKDSDGNVVAHRVGGMTFPPYGYHHILEVGAENSYWLVATVLDEIEHATVMAVAEVLAEDLTKRLTERADVQMNQNFYREICGYCG